MAAKSGQRMNGPDKNPRHLLTVPMQLERVTAQRCHHLVINATNAPFGTIVLWRSRSPLQMLFQCTPTTPEFMDIAISCQFLVLVRVATDQLLSHATNPIHLSFQDSSKNPVVTIFPGNSASGTWRKSTIAQSGS